MTLHAAISNTKSVVDVYIFPCNQDNFSYILVERETKQAVLVDAVEPEKLQAEVDKLGATVKYILTTHHHLDHSGGNHKCQAVFPEVPIIGSVVDKPPGANLLATDMQKFDLGGSISFICLLCPAHTNGHMSYYFSKENSQETVGVVFTGDFLFLAGCGRFFEGTAENMKDSIEKLYKYCPEHTWMFPGHEYSLKNLQYAQYAEPNNTKIQEKMTEIEKRSNEPSVPSTLAMERTYNPFVRAVMEYDSFPVVYTRDAGTPANLLAILRKEKDKF